MIVSCVSLFYYPLGCRQQTVVRIISLIKLSLYAPTVNKEHVQPVQEQESNTGREIAGCIHHKQSDVMPEETAHWQSVCLGSL